MSSFAELVLEAKTDSLARGELALDSLARKGADVETKVVKQAANIGREFTDAVQKVEKSVGMLALSNKKASDSASAFTSAAAQERQSFDNLRASLDPLYASSKRYEEAVREISIAQKLGIATNGEAAAAMKAAEIRYLAVDSASGKMAKGATNAAYQSKLVAMQLSQVAQQTMASGNFIQALAIQLPDMALGFGAVGIAAGVLAGVALPIVAQWFGTTSNQAEALEAAMGTLKASLGAYEGYARTATASTAELREEFGAWAAQIRSYSEYMAGVKLAQSFDDLKAVLEPVKGELAAIQANAKLMNEAFNDMTTSKGLSPDRIQLLNSNMMGFAQAVGEGAAQLGLTGDQALELGAAIDKLGAAKGIDEIATAATEAVAVMSLMFPEAEKLPPSLRASYEALGEIAKGGSSAATALGSAGGKAVDLAELLRIAAQNGVGVYQAVAKINIPDTASQQAIALAGNLGVALSVATQLNATLNANAGISTAATVSRTGSSLGFGSGTSSLTTGLGNAGISYNSSPDVKIANLQVAAAQSWTPAVIKASGGGSGSAATEIAKTTDAINDEIKALEQAANPMLKYNEGVERLNELKDAGLSDQGYAEGIKKLKEEMESATPAANELTSALTDGLGSAVDYMVNGFQDGLKGLYSIFKSTILQMISYALKNKIMVSLGLTGTATGSLASAATSGTGILGSTGGLGILGSVGSTLGTIGSSLSAGFMSSVYGGLGGMTGAVSGGLATGGVAGISTAIGAIAAPLAIVAGVISFFKTKTETIDSGIRATISMEESMFESYEAIKKTKYWGLSKKTSTNYSDMGTAGSSLQSASAAVIQGVVDSAAVIGVSADAFKNVTYGLTLSLKGLDEAAQATAITNMLTDMGNGFASMVWGLSSVKLEGEGFSDALTRLGTNLTTVNDVFSDLGFTLKETSVWGADAAYQFAQMFGGLDAMVASTSAYYETYYSDQERLTNATARLKAEFDALGYVGLPKSREELRALVDLAVDAGNDYLTAFLIQSSSAFDAILTAEETLAAERLSAAEDALQAEIDLAAERKSAAEALSQDAYTNAFDYRRAQSRTGTGEGLSTTDTGVTAPETLTWLKTIASSLQIIAADTARNVNAAEDLLAVTLGGVTA